MRVRQRGELDGSAPEDDCPLSPVQRELFTSLTVGEPCQRGGRATAPPCGRGKQLQLPAPGDLEVNVLLLSRSIHLGL